MNTIHTRWLIAAIISSSLLTISASNRRAQTSPRDLVGIWRISVTARLGTNDTNTYQGTLSLIQLKQGNAAWSTNIEKPNYIGTYVFPLPVPDYMPQVRKSFPAVAARLTDTGRIDIAMGDQSVDHGWIHLAGNVATDSICGDWTLIEYVVKVRGKYCMRRVR